MKNILSIFLLLCIFTTFSNNAEAQRRQFSGDVIKASDDTYWELNQVLVSKDGRYRMAFQDDGNLVVYKMGGRNNCLQHLFDSQTDGKNAYRLRFQTDGNLVIYDRRSNGIWSSKTEGHPNATLVMQTDGNLVIYDNGRGIWSTNTAGR